MAEYVENAVQTVEPNRNVLLTTSVGCNKGYIFFRNGSGILTLRGIVKNPCAQFARYQAIFNANVAIPTGGTAGPISIGLALNGEAIATSEAIVTPTAVDAYFNVTSTSYITIPAGCCEQISVENLSDQAINVQNAKLVITRIA